MRCHRLYRKRPAWTAVLAAALLSAAPLPAAAELTVADLTESAVSGVGPFHQDVADAIKKFGAGDYKGAYADLERAKKSTPRLAPPEVMMAQLYFDANLSSQGIVMLEQAVRSAPDDPEPMVTLGERALAERRILEAGLLFEKVAPVVTKFTENPKRRQSLQSRLYAAWAMVDEVNQNWQEARKKLEDLLLLEPQNAAVHQRLGRALFHLGKGEQAYEHFKSAAAADPKSPPAEVAMASQFTDRANAEKWLKHAITRNPKDLRTQLSAGQYYLAGNQIDEAETHALEALKLDPKGLDANALVGIIARMQGDFKTAETHLAAAHLLAPTDALITKQLALVLIELPDESSHQRAIQFAELNSKQNPDNIDCLASLGWIYYRLNRRAEGQRVLSSALSALSATREGKMNAEIGYYLATVSKDAGRIPYAIRVLKEAVDTTQPFAYRKDAQALLTQLLKMEQAQDENAGGPARGTRAAAKPAAPVGDQPSDGASTGGTP